MQSNERLTALLDKYTTNTLAEAEHAELFQLISTGGYDLLLNEHLRIQFYNKDLQGADISAEKAQVLIQKILNAEKQNSRLLPRNKPAGPLRGWKIAAAVAVLVLTSLVLMWKTSPLLSAGRMPAGGMQEKNNPSSHPLRFQLEDSTVVVLQPGALLRYPAHFGAARRETFLKGEAFFTVSKQAGRPFFVYCNNLVTHVLGTSFNIRPDKRRKLVEVTVRTGRVQVYESSDAEHHKKINGVILTPNQKVVYREEEKQFTATIVNNPLPLAQETGQAPDTRSSFVYEDASLRTVIGSLEKAYGIEMIVENEALYTCLFTGDLSRQDLYTKLDILCQSVKASYQIAGTRILIEGQGCN